jgi:hypothetical protein
MMRARTPEGAVDDDEIDSLARLTSQGLSMGPSNVTNLEDTCVMIQSKLLHPGLYECSLRDIFMEKAAARSSSCAAAAAAAKTPPALHSYRNRNGVVREKGVPGFPEFPDLWIGDVTSAFRHVNVRGGFEQSTTKHLKSSRRGQKYQQLQRKAVNVYGIKSALSAMAIGSKAIKKAKRDERKCRRIEKNAQLKERRRRKIDMGEICRGMGLIKCD